MNLDVHIEHLLLDGVQLTRRERERLPEVVQRELLALLRPAHAADADDRERRATSRLDDIGRGVALAVKAELPAPPLRGAGPR